MVSNGRWSLLVTLRVGTKIRKHEVFRVNWIFEFRIRGVDTWAQPTLTELSRYQSLRLFCAASSGPVSHPPRCPGSCPGRGRGAPRHPPGFLPLHSGRGRASGHSLGHRASRKAKHPDAPGATGIGFHPNSDIHSFFKTSVESSLSSERGGLQTANRHLNNMATGRREGGTLVSLW